MKSAITGIRLCHNGSLHYLALFIFYLILICSLDAQDISERKEPYVTKKWDNTHGLPVNTVFKITQDEDGFLWIITEEGLVRFDGITFQVYNEQNVQQLKSSWFVDLIRSADGGIWAANASAVVHCAQNQLTVYDLGGEVSNINISSIVEDSAGDLWVGTVTGDLFQVKNGQAQRLAEWNIGVGAIRVIRKTASGLVVGTEHGLFTYEKLTGKIMEVAGFEDQEIRSLAVDEDNSLWVGTRDRGLVHIRNETYDHFNTGNGLIHNHVNALHLGEDGQVWVGMSIGGVQIISGKEVIPLSEEAFGYNEIRDIYISNDGSVWLATVGHGVLQMIPAGIQTLTKADGLSDDITLAIYQDQQGVVWTGTAGAGVNRYEHGGITHIDEKDGLKHGIVVGIYGSGHHLYFGTGDGLHIYNSRSRKMVGRLTTRDGLASNTVQAIYQDSRKRLWVATRSGGIHRLHQGHRVERLTVPESYEETEFRNIFEDRKGNIWIGTSTRGLLKVSPNDKITTYPIMHGAASEMILCMWEDPEGDLWAGTNQGLVVLTADTFRMFNRKHGLHFNGIFSLVEDDYQDVWASGNFGIQQICISDLLALKHDQTDKKRLSSARLFDTMDGMINHEANGAIFPAAWKMKNGEIWFPTMGGIAIVNPEEVHQKPWMSNVHIESVAFGGKKLDPLREEVRIPPGVYNLEVKYGSLDLQKPRSIQYAYRLRNVDDEWQQAGNRTTAYFSRLSPGSYVFEVKAERYGVSSEVASFVFNVEPYFYQTAWFKGLIFLALFFAGYFVSQWYSQHRLGIKLKQQVHHKTLELEQRNRLLERAMKNVASQNQLIKEVAWMQSHQFRGPLSKVMALVEVIKQYGGFQYIGKTKEQLLEEMAAAVSDMDVTLRNLNQKMEEIEKENGKS